MMGANKNLSPAINFIIVFMNMPLTNLATHLFVLFVYCYSSQVFSVHGNQERDILSAGLRRNNLHPFSGKTDARVLNPLCCALTVRDRWR